MKVKLRIIGIYKHDAMTLDEDTKNSYLKNLDVIDVKIVNDPKWCYLYLVIVYKS